MAQSVFSGNQWTTASGSSWAVVIEPDFVNSVAELANHLALASQESRSTSEKLVENAQAASGDSGSSDARKEVVKEIVKGVKETGLNQGAEARDIEGFVNLASALIRTLFKDEDSEAESLLVQLGEATAKAGSSETNKTVNARYNALSSLFNALPESATYQTRSSILLSLFKLAVSRDDLHILSSALVALPGWISSEWGIKDSSEQDSIMSSFINTLESSASSSSKEESAELVRKLLYSYAGQNTSEELREKLLFYTLSHPSNLHDVDLESLPTSSNNTSLNQLKDIFLQGSVQDLEQFFSSNGELVDKLDKEKIKEKLQYVILADYCAGKVGDDITYDQVADVLGLPKDGDEEDRAMQVEIWVIATIRVKLLTARLHQPSSTISILQASPRRFGDAQWQLLQSRLEKWKSSISNIQETVGRALGGSPAGRQTQQQQGQGQGQQQIQSATAQDVVNAHVESTPETQQPVVEVA